ncbi:MAG: Fe-S cluster assembly ATPase SufC [Candidatus Comchoanobacterales bacterium]
MKIEKLNVQVEDKTILSDLSVNFTQGKVHVIMGPNGSGKSTLANVMIGREDYQVTEGSMTFKNQDLLTLDVTERARLGVFMAFQHPVAIPGVSNLNFLHTAVNTRREALGQKPVDVAAFLKQAKACAALVGLDASFLKRGLNDEFSGGEKKRNEILQMMLLEPDFIILDELDSGLDVDALKWVSERVNAMRSPERTIVMVTHYQRLLNLIEPDEVHLLMNGQIVESGDTSLAQRLEQEGYQSLKAAE